MCMLEFDLKKLETFSLSERGNFFDLVHHNHRELPLSFIELLAKASRTLFADYLNYCEDNPSDQTLNNLHQLISCPVLRYRDDILKALINFQSSETPAILFKLYSKSGNQMRKKILQALDTFTITEIHDVLLENLLLNEPEILVLSLQLIGKCRYHDNLGLIQNLLSHPIVTVRQKVIETLIKLNGMDWLSNKIVQLKALDPIQQEDILHVCLKLTDQIKISQLIHSHLPDKWVDTLLREWPFSECYEDQFAVIKLISNDRPKATSFAIKWLINQTLHSKLYSKITELCLSDEHHNFNGWLIKLLDKVPISTCFEEWLNIAEQNDSEEFKRVFKNQLKTHSADKKILTFLLKRLESTNKNDVLLGLECLQTDQIPQCALEVLSRSDDNEIKKMIMRHDQQAQLLRIEKQIELARNKMNEGEINQAHWLLDEISIEAQENPRYLYLFAQTKLELKEFTQARNLLHKSLQLSGSQEDVKKTLARVELDAGNTRTALGLILDCLQKNNNDALLRLWLFEAYGKANDLKEAYSCFFDIPQSIIDLNQWEAFIKYCFKLKKYKAVIQHYASYQKQLLSRMPAYHTQTYFALSLYFNREMERFKSEISELKQRYDGLESELKAWKLLDKVCGNEEIKRFYLEKRKLLYPDSVMARTEWLEFVLALNPEQVLEIENLESTNSDLKIKAKALRKLRKFEDSVEILEKLYLADASDETIPWEIGLNWFDASKHSKALKYFQFYEHHRYPPEGLGYYLSICYLRIGQLEQANASLGYSLEERPFHQPSWLLLIDLAERNKLSETLRDYLAHIPEALADNTDALIRYIQIIPNNGEKLAIDLYQQILVNEPHHHAANLGLAKTFLSLGKYSRAYHHFHIIRNDLSVEWFEQYSKAAENTLNYSEAFRLFAQLSNDESKYENLKLKMDQLITRKSSFYAIQSQWRWEDFEMHWEVLTKFPLLHYKMGVLRFSQGKFDSSKKHLAFLKNHHSHFMRSDYFLARIALHEKDSDRARLQFEDALIHSDPNPIQIHQFLAGIYLKRDNKELAKKSLLKLYACPATREKALDLLYPIYDNENRLQHLLPLLEEEFVRNNSPVVKKYLGLCFYKTRQFHRSCDLLADLTDAEALFYYGLALNQTNCFELAAQNFKGLESHSHKFEGFHYHFGITLVELNRFQAASKQFRCSIELNEKIWSSRCELVRIHLKCLNPQLAVEDFQKAMTEKFDLDLCYEMVKLCFHQELYETALQIFQENCNELLLQAEPEIFNKLCQAFLLSSHALADPQQSLEILQIFYRKDPQGMRHFLTNKDLHSQVRLTFLNLAHQQFEILSYPSLEISKMAFENENWDLAEQWLKQTEERNQRTPLESQEYFELAHHMSIINYKTGNLDLCKGYVLQALEMKPDHIEMLEKLSYLLMRERNLDEQAKIDQKLFFLRSDNAKVSERLIDWFINKDNFQNAIFHLKNYLKSHPTDLKRLKQLSEIANKSGMYALELATLTSLEDLKAIPEHDHFLRVGRACLALGQQDRAAMAFQRHLSKNPESSGLRFQLAKLYKEQGYIKKARLTLIEILREEPGNHIVRFELALILFEEKNFERCLNTLEDLFRIKPFHTEGRELMARVYYTQGRNNLAMKALDQVLQSEPDHLDALLMQARLYRSEEIHEEAFKLYERLYKITKKQEYLLEMSLINLKLGRNSTAKKQLQKLTQETEVNGKLYKIARNMLRQYA